MTRFPVTLFTLLALALPAAAQNAGSNIALTDYPAPTCVKPQLPPKPQALKEVPVSKSEIKAISPEGFNARLSNERTANQNYNKEVLAYNKAVAANNVAVMAFDACMKTYIENGNADLMRIQKTLNAAVTAANAR